MEPIYIPRAFNKVLTSSVSFEDEQSGLAVLVGPTRETALPEANTVRRQREVLEKNDGEWTG